MIALKKYIQDHDRLYKLCKLGENQNEFFYLLYILWFKNVYI